MRGLRRGLTYAGLVFAVFVVVLVGGVVAGVLGPPDAGVVDRGDWGTVNDERVTVVSTYYVDNPNPFGIDSEDTRIEYALLLNDVRLANGTKTGVAIPQGYSNDTVETTIHQERIPAWWRSHVRAGEHSRLAVQLNASVPVGPWTTNPPVPAVTENVSTDLTGTMNESVSEYEGSHPETAPVVEVRDTEVTWGTVTESETPLQVTFVVHNPNPTVMPVPAFAGNLTMNGVHVAEWNASELQVAEAPDDGTIGPGETERITFEANLQNENLDEWFTSHANNTERTNVTMTGALAVTHEGTTYTVPREGGLRCHANFQTAIFVDDQTSDSEFEHCEAAPPGVGETARVGAENLAVTDGDLVDDENVTDGTVDENVTDGDVVDIETETATETGSETETETDDDVVDVENQTLS